MAGEDIIVKAGFDGSKAERGLDKLRSQSRSFSNDLTARFAGLFAASSLLNTGLNFVAKSFAEISSVSYKAQRAGLSVEEFQRVANAANLSDVSISSVAKAIREVRKETADAAAGNEKSRKAMEDLGFTADEINAGNIKATEVLARLARAYGNARSEAEKFSVATSVLSARTGTELIPFLASGETALRSAFNRKVVSANEAEAARVTADAAQAAGQDLTSFFGKMLGSAMELAGQIGMVTADHHLRKLISEGKEDEALQYFYRDDASGGYSSNLRYMAAGGQLGSFEELQKQRFAELFPDLYKKELAARREQAIAAENRPRGAGAAVSAGPSVGVATADSLQAIGGGGYYVAGASTMTDYASRTADASERTAVAVEKIANGGGPPPVSR
jgi:hypothetical protein